MRGTDRGGGVYEPWSYHVADGARDSERHEERSGRDVGPAQEGVLAADPRHRGDDDRLRAVVRLHRVI